MFPLVNEVLLLFCSWKASASVFSCCHFDYKLSQCCFVWFHCSEYSLGLIKQCFSLILQVWEILTIASSNSLSSLLPFSSPGIPDSGIFLLHIVNDTPYILFIYSHSLFCFLLFIAGLYCWVHQFTHQLHPYCLWGF